MDCKEIQENGPYNSGVYEIFPDGNPSNSVRVFCDMETQGGGWMAIQKRLTGSVDFNRIWDEYKNGFGDPEEDFWIGNDQIHQLTKGNDSSLYVSITLVNGTTLYELYDRFSVADEAENYRLFLSGPATGTLGERMIIPGDPDNGINGMYFSTRDRDNDRADNGFQCAVEFGIGGWWYNSCHDAFLNGPWDSQNWRQPWDPPLNDGTEVRGTLMMVRRV
ncbi:fibroleukin-like [Saccostrea echinata]|uniref:fibroleukin-like n=1 Tax=Saccostrea echinata TaxID=191078 RepID=UPI002A805A46|nr:fibroleukin-like [Saccostrea echinata]